MSLTSRVLNPILEISCSSSSKSLCNSPTDIEKWPAIGPVRRLSAGALPGLPEVTVEGPGVAVVAGTDEGMEEAHVETDEGGTVRRAGTTGSSSHTVAGVHHEPAPRMVGRGARERAAPRRPRAVAGRDSAIRSAMSFSSTGSGPGPGRAGRDRRRRGSGGPVSGGPVRGSGPLAPRPAVERVAGRVLLVLAQGSRVRAGRRRASLRSRPARGQPNYRRARAVNAASPTARWGGRTWVVGRRSRAVWARCAGVRR